MSEDADGPAAEFAAAAHAQSALVAASADEPGDQAFVDALPWDSAEADSFLGLDG